MSKKFTKEQEEGITERYLLGEKSSNLAKEWNCHYSTILNIVKRNNGKTKTKSESHVLYSKDENYFNCINSEEKAYFLGLLYADGCIHNTKPRFLISLHEDDKYILDKFAENIKYNGQLYKRISKKENNSDQYCLSITSEKIKMDLIKLGCIPKKSLIVQSPTETQVPDKYINHFIRGYFDGDGSVGYTKRIINENSYKEQFAQIVGSCSFIDELILKLDFLEKINVSLVNNGNNKNIQIKNKKDFIEIYNYLYKDATIFLTRKLEKFKEILSFLENKKFIYKNEAIDQFDKELNLIKTWKDLDTLCDSLPLVRRDCVLKCIRGNAKSTSGFIWKLHK